MYRCWCIRPSGHWLPLRSPISVAACFHHIPIHLGRYIPPLGRRGPCNGRLADVWYNIRVAGGGLPFHVHRVLETHREYVPLDTVGCALFVLLTIHFGIAEDDLTLSVNLFALLLFTRGIGNVLSSPISSALSSSVHAISKEKTGFDVDSGRYEKLIVYVGTCFGGAAMVTLVGWLKERTAMGERSARSMST